jgi:hypothetical protein
VSVGCWKTQPVWSAITQPEPLSDPEMRREWDAAAARTLLLQARLNERSLSVAMVGLLSREE